eukprot:31532-Pelagococcus_subviridis.AAC.12
MVFVTAARKTSPAWRLPSSTCAPIAAPFTSAIVGNSPITIVSPLNPLLAIPGCRSAKSASSGNCDAAPVVRRMILSGFTAPAIF